MKDVRPIIIMWKDLKKFASLVNSTIVTTNEFKKCKNKNSTKPLNCKGEGKKTRRTGIKTGKRKHAVVGPKIKAKGCGGDKGQWHVEYQSKAEFNKKREQVSRGGRHKLDANPSTSEESAHPKAVTAHRRVVRASGSVWSKGEKNSKRGQKRTKVRILKSLNLKWGSVTLIHSLAMSRYA